MSFKNWKEIRRNTIELFMDNASCSQVSHQVFYTVKGAEMELDKNKIKLFHCIPNKTGLISVLLLKPNREFKRQVTAALQHSNEMSISTFENNTYSFELKKTDPYIWQIQT